MVNTNHLGKHTETLVLVFESTVRKAFKLTLGDILRGRPMVDMRKGRKVACHAGTLIFNLPYL